MGLTNPVSYQVAEIDVGQSGCHLTQGRDCPTVSSPLEATGGVMLTRRPGERAFAEQVDVEMRHGFAAVAVLVDDEDGYIAEKAGAEARGWHV